jgi:hypothetical protein
MRERASVHASAGERLAVVGDEGDTLGSVEDQNPDAEIREKEIDEPNRPADAA